MLCGNFKLFFIEFRGCLCEICVIYLWLILQSWSFNCSPFVFVLFSSAPATAAAVPQGAIAISVATTAMVPHLLAVPGPFIEVPHLGIGVSTT